MNKFDCLTEEMLFIRQKKPELNVQGDSILLLKFLLNFKPVFIHLDSHFAKYF